MTNRDETRESFALQPQGPFSLEPARKMECGFLRGTRSCGLPGEPVRFAFPLDGTFRIAGVALTWDGKRVQGTVAGGSDSAAVKKQVARVLAVDHDATPFARLLNADPSLQKVSGQHPGFRPVVAYSPYVMAGWSVLSQRIRMSQAAAMQIRIAETAGDVVEVDGEPIASFPRPESLLRLKGFQGVSAEKWERLQAVARAALNGQFDQERLLAMPYDEARDRLMSIRGIGPWTADAVLIRGCGPTDVLPLTERTLHGAVALTYGLEKIPTDKEVVAIAESWRPFRTWVSVMLIAHHFDAAKSRLRQTSPPRRTSRARA